MWPPLTRGQIEAAVGVVMRVPGLFIIDYWWQYDRNKSLPQSMEGTEILNAIMTNLVLFHGFLLLLLPLPYVRALYTHFIGGALLFSSHLLSGYYIQMEQGYTETKNKDTYFLQRQLSMLTAHVIISGIVSSLLQSAGRPPLLLLSSCSLPVIARLLDFPIETLQLFHNFSSASIAVSIFLYIYHHVPVILDCVKLAYMDALLIAEIYGWMALLTVLWNKLFVPTHFAVFWLIDFVARLVGNFYQREKVSIWGDEWYITVLSTISSICASPVTLVATSVTVSYLSYFALCATKAYLQGRTAFLHDNPMHSGWTEGFTFVLLALQTGLTEMKMPARMAVMTIILFIVLSSLLQSMLEITEPVVLSLSASRSKSINRHIRAFSLCCILFVFPLYLTYILSSMFPIDFWMMVVLSSCVLASFQVLDLFVVHCLFLYDSSRDEAWESLDDVVYYTRAVTKIFEFLVAVFVVGMGLWESTGKWNWVNASILLVHCYFNVWQRLQTGWKSFLLRREAVKKAESLPAATLIQLSEHNDVCAICFANMEVACLTPCQHYFHRTCLRKWLYIQDKCPLCHTTISVTPQQESTSANQEDNSNQSNEVNDASPTANEDNLVHNHPE
ncbi:RING finger protein 145-like [Centruroides vittatus]|uniref:RING finger protein 145-like n=1 Tax=Centruroides vittatus TaxID=120091 RepID=UPI00350FA424